MKTTQSFIDGFKYYPISVDFAGLIGDTNSMRRNGWVLNVNSVMEERFDAISIYIAGKHDGLKLRFLSGRMQFDHRSIMMDQSGFLKNISIPCCISSVANNIIVNMMGENNLTCSVDNWSGLIGTPIKSDRYSIDELFHFPTSDNSIVIPESKIWTIEEHLNAIRKSQQSFQDELLRIDNSSVKTQTKLSLVGVA